MPLILAGTAARCRSASTELNLVLYREQGYLPGRFFHLALLRLESRHGAEIFSVDEAVHSFSFGGFSTAAPGSTGTAPAGSTASIRPRRQRARAQLRPFLRAGRGDHPARCSGVGAPAKLAVDRPARLPWTEPAPPHSTRTPSKAPRRDGRSAGCCWEPPAIHDVLMVVDASALGRTRPSCRFVKR